MRAYIHVYNCSIKLINMYKGAGIGGQMCVGANAPTQKLVLGIAPTFFKVLNIS